MGWRDMSALAVRCLHSIGWAGIWVHRVLIHTGEESFLKVLHAETHKSGGNMQCSPREAVCLSTALVGNTQNELKA